MGEERRSFTTTHWSVVLDAGGTTSPRSRDALASLCEKYWPPLYVFVRRRGYAVEEAQDLTQEFFARLLEKDYLKEVKRERGKFRTFLLACLKHFLANEWDKATAQKRGGGETPISLDAAVAEGQYQQSLAHDLTPDRLYEQQWALSLLDQVLAQLRADYVGSGKEPLFDQLKGYLSGGTTAPSHRETGEALGMAEAAVKMAVHRLRKRYRSLLHAEIAQTVGDEGDINQEMQDLFAALSPNP